MLKNISLKFICLVSLVMLILLIGCSTESEILIDEEYDILTYEYLSVEKENSDFSDINYSFINKEIYQNGTINYYYVTNPNSNAEMYVSVYVPNETDGKTIILIPGGIGSSDDFIDPGMVDDFMGEGFITIIFDADGRGLSSGEEDYNGYVQQDGLYGIYRFVENYDGVNKENIGLASFSYGVSMASGMLGRYQDSVNIKYYIEWEGPTNRFYVTVGCKETSHINAIKEGVDCNDEEYWLEREALRFVPYFKVDYFQIIQGQKDHVQSTYMHSVDANNLAVKYLDWVKVNDGDINQLYNNKNVPVIENYLVYLNEYALNYAIELSEK
ncbi:hypothetical protein HN385_06420 [archaeon]|jgi:hypothetical protein|nr:hypothetical protein [archaeon]MBT3450754.1 hypothetical protein [archaeon]MBT6869517.1 hypothetical protein [archaeon]MBT7193682.1 hypothetical protein [archaeon]MBT7380373.1 hypothetical protein [archaeon]